MLYQKPFTNPYYNKKSMNKMTIAILVLFLALLSYGTIAYAQNKVDSAKVESNNIKKDSLLEQEIALEIQATKDSLQEAVSSLKTDISSIKVICYSGICVTIILLLLVVLALILLAQKASKKKLEANYEKLRSKMEKMKDDIRWETAQSRHTSARRDEQSRSNNSHVESSYMPKHNVSSDKGKQPAAQETANMPSDSENGKKPEKKRALKEVFLSNNEGDIFTRSFETKQDGCNFLVEYDPEDKSGMGVLSVIGSMGALRVMNTDSRDCSIKKVKDSCAWGDAVEYEMIRPGKVVLYQNAWKILNQVEIVLKR